MTYAPRPLHARPPDSSSVAAGPGLVGGVRRTAAPARRSGCAPTPEEVEVLKGGLLRRDELAARLVHAVRVEHAVTMPQFRQALEHGIDSVSDAPAALREFFDAVEARPDWVDDDLLEQGARASRRIGPDGQDILAYGSLLGGYRTAAGLEPLVRSGRLAGKDALRRVGETGAWWLGCTSPGGMARGGEGWRLSVHVRVMHGFVNHQLERADDWDWDLRGVPINAVDQAATIGTFSTSYLLHARLLGVRVSRSDARAIMHLWSYAGWLMGVEPQWLPRTEQVGRRVLYQFVSTDPGPDENGRTLAAALLEMTDHHAAGGRTARTAVASRAGAQHGDPAGLSARDARARSPATAAVVPGVPHRRQPVLEPPRRTPPRRPCGAGPPGSAFARAQPAPAARRAAPADRRPPGAAQPFTGRDPSRLTEPAQ